MKKNIFGWPVFTGKVVQKEDSNKICSVKCGTDVWMTFRNDLTAISFTKEQQTEVEGFTTLFNRDSKMVLNLMNLAALACGIMPADISEKQLYDFLMYSATANSDEVPMRELRKTLETECKEINGVGYRAMAK